MTNKQRYEKFCGEHPDIPLFMQAWWLSAVCVPEKKDWDVLFAEENGTIVGVMPYHLLKKWGFRTILQPQLTQYNGVWIDYPKDISPHKRYSFENKVMDNLIDQLEKLNVSYFSQNFHHSFTNWLPFYWKNFKQTTRYTYILKNIADIDAIFENISTKYRKSLRKCEKELTVDFNLSPEDFYDFHKNSFYEENDSITYPKQLFLSIFQTATERNQGKIIAIRNKNNELLYALFFVWDKNSGYNLITARNKINKSNDTLVYIIWEAIKYLNGKTKNYDFEGSMIEGVAAKNQRYGAEQVPYFNITKSYSKIFSLLLQVKTKLNF